MRSRAAGRDGEVRQKLARAAAQVMLEGGIQDYGLAKRKAQERLRLPSGTPLPSNQEIEDAVREHQRLFGGSASGLKIVPPKGKVQIGEHRVRIAGRQATDRSGCEREQVLSGLRTAAVQAMRQLALFKPRLVGPVLVGTADRHTPVSLHLFAESPEEVGFSLMDRGIPYRNTDHRLRMSTGETERVPGFSFFAGDVAFELVVFSGRTRGHTPLSPVDGRAMQRAGLREVESLLACEEQEITG